MYENVYDDMLKRCSIRVVQRIFPWMKHENEERRPLLGNFFATHRDMVKTVPSSLFVPFTCLSLCTPERSRIAGSGNFTSISRRLFTWYVKTIHYGKKCNCAQQIVSVLSPALVTHIPANQAQRSMCETVAKNLQEGREHP